MTIGRFSASFSITNQLAVLKISILTPSYNSASYLETAIKSVLAQDYPHWEHIIVDGKSTDHTREILERYPHLQWISEPDQGQSDAMNKAFALSSGEIIVYLNADDLLAEQALSSVAACFEADAQVEMVVGSLELCFPEGNTFTREPSEDYYEILQFWLNKFPANPVSYFYRRELQVKIGHFPIDNHYTMDYWFLLRAYKVARIQKIPKILGTFVSTEGSKTRHSNVEKNLYRTALTYLNKEENLQTKIWFQLRYGIEKGYRWRNFLFQKS